MERFTGVLLKNKKLILTIVAVLLLLAVAATVFLLVDHRMNSDMLVYIGEEFPTSQGLNFLKENFNINGDAMMVVEGDADDPELYEIIRSFEDFEGMTQLVWYGALDEFKTLVDLLEAIGIPTDQIIDLEGLTSFLRRPIPGTDRYHYVIVAMIEYSPASQEAHDMLNEMERRLAPRTLHAAGMSAMGRRVLNETMGELPVYLGIGLAVVVILLLLLSDNLVDPFIVLITVGVALLLNMGSNLLLPSVSIVSFAAGAILQLAVTTDYALYYCYEYRRRRTFGMAPVDSATGASRIAGVILRGALITAGGFCALYAMRFTIGADIANVVIKGIVLSVLSVWIVTPCLLTLTDRMAERTTKKRRKHKKLSLPFRLAQKKHVGKVVAAVSVLLLTAGIVLTSQATFSYFNVFVKGDNVPPEAQLAEVLDNQFIVAVPVMPKDGKTHTEFIEEAEKLERVDRALGAFSALKLPAQTIVLLLDNTKFITGNPTVSGYFAKVDTENGAEWFTLYNIVIKGSAEDQKGEETYRALNALLEEYFDSNYQFGMMVGVNDMRVGTPRDFAIVSGILAAISVILCILLLASLRKGIAVALLSMLALFVNLAISTLLGESINFIIYLLIGAVQLGYSVDTALFVLYAPRRNREGEEGMLARLVAEEEERCLRWKPIVTSLCVLLAVTLSVYFVSGNLVVQDMAMLMARGGVIACFVQLFFLPALAGSTPRSRFWRKQKLS